MFSSQGVFCSFNIFSQQMDIFGSKQKVFKIQQNNCDLCSRELSVSSKALKIVTLVQFLQPGPYNLCGLSSWTLPGNFQCPQQWLHLQLILPKTTFQNSSCFPQYRFSISSRNRPNWKTRSDWKNNAISSPRACISTPSIKITFTFSKFKKKSNLKG